MKRALTADCCRKRAPCFFRLQTNLGFCFGEHGNHAAVAVAAVEVYRAINECIERVILAHAYIFAGIVHRTALTHDNVACDAGLSTPNLNA